MGNTSLCFWSIERLKRQLIGQEISVVQEFIYLLLVLLIQFVNGMLLAPDPTDTLSDVFFRWFSIGGTFIGTVFAFLRNGGPKGREFQKRFFALYWILTIRFLLIGFFPIVLWAYGSVAINLTDEVSRWSETILFASLQLVFYWRLSFHIASVACSEEHAQV
ncbi:MAG TPA: hypothetical protein VM532_07990 [Burkholderiales bacterium]|nr:hypothetical protein [Burkholderiales bacterium]